VKTEKKVCHIISGYFRNDARIFYRQCLSLKNNGYNVSILTNDAEANEIVDGIQIISVTKVLLSRWKRLLLSTNIFFKHAVNINADIYQLHSPELLPLALKLKKLGKKVVYDAHEDMAAHILEKEWLPIWSRKILSFCFNIYINYVFKKIDEIISPLSHVVKNLQNLTGKGVLITNFPIVKNTYEVDKLNYLSRNNIFCYSGTVYKYSNQETIAKALLSAPEALYHLAGYIDNDQYMMLINSEVNDRIRFFGRLNKLDLSDFYKNSIAGIVIYDYKRNLGNQLGSFGTNKIFEYMEAGLPIICTDFELWKDIVQRYQCGICVKPGDADSLAQAINQIVNDRKSAFLMGNNSRRAIENEFNWRSEEIKYLNLFNNLIS
jgi:glycosyltransferase involved in cell wall biosynthesis